jgi:hypothetical protein
MAFEDLNEINAGDKITATWLNRLILKVNELERTVASLQQERDQPRIVESAPLEITGVETEGTPGVLTARTITKGVVDLTEDDPDIDSLGTQPDDNDSVVWDLDAIPNAVLARYLGMSEGRMVFASPPKGFFPVHLTQGSGSQGTTSAAPTYVYTCKSLDQTITLGESIAVVGPRPFGRVDALTYGIAFYVAGDLKLWCAEQPKKAAC